MSSKSRTTLLPFATIGAPESSALSLRTFTEDPIGHQVLLAESLDEIRTNFFAEQSPEQQIGPVNHIDHQRLHLLIVETRKF